MKRLYLIIIILSLNCNIDTNNSEKKKENQIQCLLVSRLIAEQTFVPNKIDQEAYLNALKTTMTANVVCNDYLNKKDGVD